MPYSNPEDKRRHDRDRKKNERAAKKTGAKTVKAPAGKTRHQHTEEQKKATLLEAQAQMEERKAAAQLQDALDPGGVNKSRQGALRVIGELPSDRTDQQIMKEKLIRELYPDINNALLNLLINLGLVVNTKFFGLVLQQEGLEPLLQRLMLNLGPVFEEEIPRGGALDPLAVQEMKAAHAKVGALMVELGYRKLQMVDPSQLSVSDAKSLIQMGAKLEQETRHSVAEEEGQDSARNYGRALMRGGKGNIKEINNLLKLVAEGMSPNQKPPEEPPAAAASPRTPNPPPQGPPAENPAP